MMVSLKSSVVMRQILKAALNEQLLENSLLSRWVRSSKHHFRLPMASKREKIHQESEDNIHMHRDTH